MPLGRRPAEPARARRDAARPTGRTSLAVEYGLPAEGPACLEVYDSLGERVGVLAQGRLARGAAHEHLAPASGCPPGAYWWRLRADGIDLLRPATLRA